MAQTTQDALHHFHGHRYHLLAWCIMPNHVHVLLETLTPLPTIVQSWKAFTTRWARQHAAELAIKVPTEATDNSPKTLWMRDYWDRYIRNEKHYHAVQHYIVQNPVNAGLCKKPEDWRWSSAYAGEPDPES